MTESNGTIAETLANAQAIAEKHGLVAKGHASEAPEAPETDEAEDDEPEAQDDDDSAEDEAADDDDEEDSDDGDEASDDAPAARMGIRALDDAQIIALRRAKVPQAVIDKLDDADLIALADQCADNERRNKEHFESLTGKRPPQADTGNSAEGKKRAGEEGAAPAPEPAPKADPPVGRTVPRNLPEPVRDALGLSDDEVKPLEEWLQGAISDSVASVRAEADTRVKAMEKVAKDALAKADRSWSVAEYQMTASIRADLAKVKWPEIAAPEQWEKVRAQAKAIAPGYAGEDLETSMQRLFFDAAWRVLGPPADAQPRKPTPKPASKEPEAKTAPAKKKPKAKNLSPVEITRRNALAAQRKHGIRADGSVRRW